MFGGFAKPVVEDALLENANAAETPRGADELLDKGMFGRSLRVEFALEGLQELFEGCVLFGIEDDIGGGEAMGNGIQADGGAPFGCAGASAFFSVPAIGVDLLLGGHGGYGDSRVARGGEPGGGD